MLIIYTLTTVLPLTVRLDKSRKGINNIHISQIPLYVTINNKNYITFQVVAIQEVGLQERICRQLVNRRSFDAKRFDLRNLTGKTRTS